MAGADRMTIEEVVRRVLLDEHADVIREAVRAVAAEMMELEVSELICAARGERRPESYLNRFDIQSGRRLGPPVQISRLPALAWPTPDERRIVVSGEDGTTIRDATGKHVLRRFPRGFRGQDFWTALSPDGRTLAAGGQDGSLRLMDLRTGRVRTASGRHSAAVGRGIVFTRDGRRVITPGDDGAVIVWDVRTAAVAETFSGHGGAVRGLAVTADGRTLYSAGADGSVFIWDLAGDRRLGRPFTAGAGNEGSFPRYALSSDGRLLALGQRDGMVSIVDTRTLARLGSFPVTTVGKVPHEDGVAHPEVLGMLFLPRSHRLVVGGFEGFLAIVDTDSGRVLRRLRGHLSAVYTPGISADGRLMVTTSFDQTVRFWSLPDGRQLGAPLRFTHIPLDAQLSPDGRWAVVVIEMSDRLQIIDARTHHRVRTPKGNEGLFFARFSPDGTLLAVGDAHGRTEVWSTATWRPITHAFAGQAGATQLAAISPDDRTLATGSSDGTVRLWDIKTEQPLGARTARTSSATPATSRRVPASPTRSSTRRTAA